MSTPHELDEVKRRLERLERELGEARRDIAALERRAAVKSFIAERPPVEAAKPPPLPVAPVSDPVPVALPPPLPSPSLAPPPVPARFRPAEPEAEEFPLRDWLRRLQLWPPEAEEGGAEARLGAWWATRIGTLLAVVGVVFFGIYVSLHTPPWVKFVELVAVAFGVAGLGLWLERRVAAFGSVVFAGGLALLFFAAYAGHALPGVRVFESFTAGVLAQTAAVAVIVGASLWRRSSGVATLAIGLGYVTAFVSGRGGLDGYALGAAVTLAVVAVALRRWRGWEGPSVVAMPAAYAIFALGLEAARTAGVVQLPPVHWVALTGLATLFFMRDWRNASVDTEEVSLGEKVFQNANSSFALLCGAAVALGWARGSMEVFYLGAAAWCGVAAWVRTRQVRGGDVVAAVLLAKMTGALTLGVIEVAGARSAALALLVQAWVLAWTARRISSQVLAVGAALVAIVATGYFCAYGLVGVPLWSRDAAGAVLFTLGLAALAIEGGRWLVADAQARRMLAVFGAGAGAGIYAMAAANWTPAGWAPALWMGGALLFGALAGLRRSGSAVCAAGGLALVANAGLWMEIRTGGASAFVAWNALIVLVPTILVGCLPLARRWGTLAWSVAAVGLSFTAFELLPADQALGGLALLASGLVAASPGLRRRHLPWLATLLAGLATWQWLAFNAPVSEWSWLGLALIWTTPVALRLIPTLDAVRRDERGAAWLEGMQVIVGTILALGVIVRTADSGTEALFALSALAVATGLASWLGRVAAAGWALGPLGAVLTGVAWIVSLERAGGTVSSGFWAVSVAGLVLAALPLRPGAASGHWPRGVARVLGALAAVAVLFSLFAAQRGALAPYVTVGWGGVAILLFMAGLFRRALSYRVIGLLALSPCLLRVFLIDLHSTLHRIAAFIALGLVFLWVGFSYHRFRHLLVPGPSERNPESSSS